MLGIQSYNNVLDNNDIEYLLSQPDVILGKVEIDKLESGVIHLNTQIPLEIKSKLLDQMGLDLMAIDFAPLRWIKGDLFLKKKDKDINDLQDNYSVYITESEGYLVIDGNQFPIKAGFGYVFNGGLSHETINTRSTPRLLLGPMSATGIPVSMNNYLYINNENVKNNNIDENIYSENI